MRIPLATTLRNRTQSTDTGARLLNAVVDSKKRVVKRPSLVASYGPVEVGPGLALFVRTTPGLGGPSEELIAISNEILNTSPSVFTEPNYIFTTINFDYNSDPPQVDRIGFDTRSTSGGPFGAVSPATYNGVAVYSFQSAYDSAADAGNIFVLNTEVSQSFFTSITVNGTTILSASATTYSASGGITLWAWENIPNILTSGGIYPATIV